MIPVSVVRFSPDGPCVLQASASQWVRLVPLLRRDAGKDVAKLAVVDGVRSRREGEEGAQRVTLSPALARWVLDVAAGGA